MMKKSEAMQKVMENSNYGLNNRNTHFANINTTPFMGKGIWWLEVPRAKFAVGFYLLFCNKNDSLILLRVPGNAINLANLSYRKDADCHRFYICCDLHDRQYMCDLVGPGKLSMKRFVVAKFD